MNTILFATQNSNKADAFRLITTIEREGEHVVIYKRSSTSEANQFVNELVRKQQIATDYIGNRAYVVHGTLANGGIRYPYIQHPTLQSLLADAILADNYQYAFSLLERWIEWIHQLPTVTCDPTNHDVIKTLFGTTIPPTESVCLATGLLDLTTDNVFVDGERYIIIDHELVLDAPIPRDFVIFRALFFLCTKINSLLMSNASRHPLQQLGFPGFVVPVSWSIQRWIDTQKLEQYIQAEEHLQNCFSAFPVRIPRVEGIRIINQDSYVNIDSYLQENVVIKEKIDEAHSRLHSANIQITAYGEEITRLREERSLSQDHIDNLNRIIASKESLLAHAQQQLSESKDEIAHMLRRLQATDSHFVLYQRRVEELHSGVGYRLLTHLRDTRWRLMPAGTRSNAVYMRVRNAVKLWRDHGGKAVARKSATMLLTHAGLHQLAERVNPSVELVARQDRLRIRAARADVQAGETWPETIFMRSGNALYSEWLSNNVPTPAELRQQRASTNSLEYIPLISVITPVYNVQADWLSRCIDSVLAQTYNNWEICLVDDFSTAEHIRPLLEKYASQDQRIRIHFSQSNQGIAGATNIALEMANGEFVALLDNDDELAPHALFSIVDRLQHSRQADILYSDEDKITTDNHRDVPHFKADYAPDMLHSYNYICHLLVMRTSLARSIGGLSSDFDGAQDYDFILRAIESTHRSRIVHITDVLYHWRMIPGSTATAYDNKSAVRERTRRLLHEHLKRTCGNRYGHIESDEARGTYHVVYDLHAQPLVSIVICTKDKVQVLKTCIDSLRQTTYPNYEIIIVDNGSQDPETHAYYRDALRTIEHIRVVEQPQPFNYSRLNNIGITQSQGDIIVLLNNDTELITPDWLEQMLGFVQQERVGVVGIKLLYPTNTIQHAGIIMGIGGVAGHSHKYIPADSSGYFNIPQIVRNYSAVTGACMMFRRSVWEKVGGLEEELAVAFNDVEFCLKVGAAGYDIVYTPYVVMWHHESISVGRVEKRERVMDVFEIEYMRRNWSAEVLRDPFYNPNLTLTHENYAINPARRKPTEYTPEMIGHRAELGVVQDYYNFPVGELVEGRRVEQSFVNERGDLFAFEILPATYARQNDGVVHVALLNAERDVLQQWKIPAADIDDNSWRRFSFPVIEDSVDTMFWIAIWCEGSRPQSAITLWHATESGLYRAGQLIIDGQHAMGALAFRCFVLVPVS